MKKNHAVILLLLILIVVVTGVVRYRSPAAGGEPQQSFRVEYHAVDPASGTSESPESPSQPDPMTESIQIQIMESSSADETFAADDWAAQINDYLDRLDAAILTEEEERQKEQEREEELAQNDSDTTDDPLRRFSEKDVLPVIIDTDFASDADDVVAVRLAMCFQDAGMLDIRGIALSTTYSRSPLAVHALCTQDGYGSIPVAMDTSGNGVQVHTDYVDVMYDQPKSRSDYEQPVAMYRRILSESDGRVHIITLGFLQNIQGLMNSAPDQYSPLSGMELIAQKVDTLYICGGNSTGKPSFNFYWTGEKVISAAKDVARSFPARTIFLQSDLSDDTFCGQFYNTKDYHQRDIVTRALKANDQAGGVVAWDVFAVWCAVQDMTGNLESAFLELEQGSQYVSGTGATEWTASAGGRHLKMYKNVEGAYYSEIMNNMLLQKYNSTHNSA